MGKNKYIITSGTITNVDLHNMTLEELVVYIQSMNISEICDFMTSGGKKILATIIHDNHNVRKAFHFIVNNYSKHRKYNLYKFGYMHSIEVASIVAEYGFCNEDIIISALLHDVLEDIPNGEEYLKGNYNKDIVKLVESLTEEYKSGSSLEQMKFSWEERKLIGLSKIIYFTPELLALKIAEQISNIAETINDLQNLASENRYKYRECFDAGYKGYIWKYSTLCKLAEDRIKVFNDKQLFQNENEENGLKLLFNEFKKLVDKLRLLESKENNDNSFEFGSYENAVDSTQSKLVSLIQTTSISKFCCSITKNGRIILSDIVQNNPKVKEAILFIIANYNQHRKYNPNKFGYMHCIEAAALMAEHGFCELNEISAALLHDVREDIPKGEEYLRSTYDENTVKLVKALTEKDKSGYTREEEKSTRYERKSEEMEKVSNFYPNELALKLADQMSNIAETVNDLEKMNPEERQKYRENFNAGYDKQIWKYSTLCDIIQKRIKSCQDEHLFKNEDEEIRLIKFFGEFLYLTNELKNIMSSGC